LLNKKVQSEKGKGGADQIEMSERKEDIEEIWGSQSTYFGNFGSTILWLRIRTPAGQYEGCQRRVGGESTEVQKNREALEERGRGHTTTARENGIADRGGGFQTTNAGLKKKELLPQGRPSHPGGSEEKARGIQRVQSINAI